MGYISLPLSLNVTIGIRSYYCVILKIVILHDGIKTIQNGAFLFSLKTEQHLVSLKKKKIQFFFKEAQKTHVGCFFLKKIGCSQPD